MNARLDYRKLAPEAFHAIIALDRVTGAASGLGPRILNLIKLRASQLNGCAYCVDIHVKDALRDGESPQRVHLLAVWRESPLYTEEERALLNWTESVTRLSETKAPDADFAPLRAFFSDEQIAKITFAIATINVWNRLAVSFREQHPIDPPSHA